MVLKRETPYIPWKKSNWSALTERFMTAEYPHY